MKIVVLDGYTTNPGDLSWEPLERLGKLEVFPRTPADKIIERSSSADILLTNKTPLDAATLEQLAGVKFISCMATGFNVIDVSAARSREISVSNVPIYSTQSVAQHVFAMLLSLHHQPQRHHDAIQQGQWKGDFCFTLNPITELVGKTMGIIGYGRIGDAVGRLASAFGMNVKAYRRTPGELANYDRFEWASLDEVITESDYLSIHCPQTESNGGMVNADFLKRMKPSAILVNTARGGLVNEADLAQALADGEIAGACIDVVSAEPIADDNPLLGAVNCLMTPHIAWSTIEARTRLLQTSADNVEAFQNGKPINVVN